MTANLSRWHKTRALIFSTACGQPEPSTRKGNLTSVRSSIIVQTSSISRMPQTGFELPLAPDWKLRFAGQYVDQGSVGDNLLQGHSFSGHQFGIKVELPIKKALFTAAFTQAWGTANLQNPWSGYPGYTSVQVQDFNRAGEGAFLLRAGYDFPWVDGLSAYALAVFGTDPDLANQYRQNEFDFNLQWGPKKGVLEGLSLRLRYAVVQQFGGNVDNLTDFRAIFNYVIKF